MSDASTPIGPPPQKVLEFAGTIERTVPAAKDAAFTDAAWAPLASLFATAVFERIGIWREVINWREYIAFLTKFASAKGFESTVRRITETPNFVFYEIEEHNIKDANNNIINPRNVFASDN